MVNTLRSGRGRATATPPNTTLRHRQQAFELATSIDDAAAEMERDGPASPDGLQRALIDLEVEWANEPDNGPASTKRPGLPTR
jgi:hypothetical protein